MTYCSIRARHSEKSKQKQFLKWQARVKLSNSLHFTDASRGGPEATLENSNPSSERLFGCLTSVDC